MCLVLAWFVFIPVREVHGRSVLARAVVEYNGHEAAATEATAASADVTTAMQKLQAQVNCLERLGSARGEADLSHMQWRFSQLVGEHGVYPSVDETSIQERFGRIVGGTHLGLRLLPSEELLWCAMVLGGALGACSRALLKSSAEHKRNLVQPATGLAYGLMALLALKSGGLILLQRAPTDPPTFQPFAAAAVGVLAGWYRPGAKRLAELLNDHLRPAASRGNDDRNDRRAERTNLDSDDGTH